MGCCVSTSNSSRSSHSASSLTKDKDLAVTKASENRAPPPVEEETVKEVLSETPKWKPTVAKFEAEKPPQKPSFNKFQGESKVEKKASALATVNKGPEEISEVSEVCSLSESVSTTTITDKREKEEETRQRVNRSPAKMRKNRSFTGERTVGKSPARRSEQSPVPRNVGPVRVVQSREQMGNGVTRNPPRRRDARENSGRRSRSPATRTDNGPARAVVGRSQSVRRTNQSPARVRAAVPESGGQKMESPTSEGKWASANESLENPLVSLECFIFL